MKQYYLLGILLYIKKQKFKGELTMSNENLTGYPSIDKPWLKYYKSGAEDMAKNIPLNKTVWDVIENIIKIFR